MRLHLRPLVRRAVGSLALFASTAISACGGGPPFNQYDPPPSFAIKYEYSDPVGYQLVPNYDGSQLYAEYTTDLVSQQYSPLGYTGTQGPVYIKFGNWWSLQNARWPARWNVHSISGCGAGTYETLNVYSKLNYLSCHPVFGPIVVTPTTYANNNPPSYLTLQFDTGHVPTNSWSLLYLADPAYNNIVNSQWIFIDGNGQTIVGAPPLTQGNYVLLAEHPGASNFSGSTGQFNTYVNQPDTTFYWHINFSGSYFTAADGASFIGWDWNDQLSSVDVPPGKTVVLYENYDFTGQTLTLTGSQQDLRLYQGPGADGTWNDAASAYWIY